MRFQYATPADSPVDVVRPAAPAADTNAAVTASWSETGIGTVSFPPVHGVATDEHEKLIDHDMSAPESTGVETGVIDTSSVPFAACAGTAPTNANKPTRTRANAPEATDLVNDAFRTRLDRMSPPLPLDPRRAHSIPVGPQSTL